MLSSKELNKLKNTFHRFRMTSEELVCLMLRPISTLVARTQSMKICSSFARMPVAHVSKSQTISKLHNWFKSYKDFAE